MDQSSPTGTNVCCAGVLPVPLAIHLISPCVCCRCSSCGFVSPPGLFGCCGYLPLPTSLDSVVPVEWGELHCSCFFRLCCCCVFSPFPSSSSSFFRFHLPLPSASSLFFFFLLFSASPSPPGNLCLTAFFRVPCLEKVQISVSIAARGTKTTTASSARMEESRWRRKWRGEGGGRGGEEPGGRKPNRS